MSRVPPNTRPPLACIFARLLRAGAVAALAFPLAVDAACGPISGDYPVFAGDELKVKKDVTVNGNPIADGDSSTGSTIGVDGSRGTSSTALPDLDPATFPANASSADATEADAPFVASTDAYYDAITIDKEQTATFTGGGPFHVAKLEVKEGATLRLAAGVYYIDELKLAKEVVLEVLTEDVVLHIGTKADIDKEVDANVGGSVTGLQVMLHAGAKLDAENKLDFTGIIYGPDADEVKIDKDSDFHGVIAVGGKVEIAKDVEWTLTPADQDAIDAASTCAASDVDHLAIVHDGSAVNCQPEPVVIVVHDAGHDAVTEFTGVVALSTSTGHGDWSVLTGDGTLTSTGGGVASYTFDVADAGEVTLALGNSFVEVVNIDAVSDSVGEHASEDPDLDFADTGFTFLAGGVPGGIGTQIARKPSGFAPGAQLLELQAIRTSPVTGACESALTGTVDVEVAYECVDPGSCTVNPLWLSGRALAGNPAGPAVAYTVVSLDFGDVADTTAPIDLVYDDVGAVRLHARRAFPDGSGNAMLGSSNAFVVRPFGLDVDLSDDREVNGIAGASYAADAMGSAFAKAGAGFDVTVTAVAWQAGDDLDADGFADVGANLSDNVPTPNFGQELAPVTAAVTHALVEPAAGSVGSLTGAVAIGGFSGGAATGTVAYTEVGIIDITAAHVDYLGSGAAVIGTVANVGRFYPARLHVSDSAPALRDGPDGTWSCGFTYMDQPFAFDADPVFTISARNLAGAVTRNYGGGFWKFTRPSYLTGRTYADNVAAGATLDAPNIGIVTLAGTADYDGQATLTIAGERFTHRRPVAPVAAFAADLDLTLAGADLVDADGVCHHPTDPSCNTGDVTMNVSADYTVAGIGGATVRFGRLEMTNVAGSELLPLTVPLAASYFDGAGFVVNADDTCTSVGVGVLDLVNDADDPPSGTATIQIAAGASTAVVSNQPLAAGQAGLDFSAPLAGNTGYVDARLDLSIATGADLEWLRFDWDGDGSHDDEPTGRATFGIYSGPDFLIHVREPW